MSYAQAAITPRASQAIPVSPFPGDVVVIETVNATMFPTLPEFGAPHPNSSKYPNHQFGWAGDPLQNGVQPLYYVAERQSQHLYNWETDSSSEWPRVVQSFVVPRDDFDITFKDYSPPPPELIDCSEYEIIEIQQRRMDDQRFDSLFVRVNVIREKLIEPLRGVEFDSETGVLVTTEKQKVPAGTAGSGISDDGTYSEVQPINSAWSIRTTRKAAGIVAQASGGTATRTYPIIVNYSWPAVLWDLSTFSPRLRLGGYAPMIVRPNWLREAYNGPCVAAVVETWTKTIPSATLGVSMNPTDVNWDGRLFSFNETNILHRGLYLYETPGTDHPTYEYYWLERYYPPTNPIDWPAYVTSQIDTRPYFGGWLQREIRVYNPQYYGLSTGIIAGLSDINPRDTTVQWVTGVAGTASVYIKLSSGSWGSATATGLSGSTYTFTSLSPGISYDIKVVIGSTTSNIITFTTVNELPVITNSPLTAAATQGVSFSGFTITATGGELTYYAANLVAGLAVNSSSGAITGTPSSTSGGAYNIPITATNAAGADTETLVLTYTAIPIITSSLTSAATEGAAFTYTTSASNTPTSFNATSLPGGLSTNTGTGVTSGTPTGTSSTTWNIGISATNAAGTDSETLAVTYTAIPRITAAQSFTHTASSTLLSDTVLASNTPTYWTVDSDPNDFFSVDHTGMYLNPTTGAIEGDLSATTGVYIISLTATNDAGTSSPTNITYTVT